MILPSEPDVVRMIRVGCVLKCGYLRLQLLLRRNSYVVVSITGMQPCALLGSVLNIVGS